MSPIWPSPAKLNLFLNIVGRRADGYHLLQTVYQFLDHGDELVFKPRSDGFIGRLHSIPGVSDAQDLTLRAARLLKSVTGTRAGVEISVKKCLPIGGGLGGGSSNAATTLCALNELWECGLDEEHLAQLGLQLGADVPVFVGGRAAWAEGIGEDLEPIEIAEPWYLVVKPKVNISTAEVYSAPELTRACPRITIREFLSGRAENVLASIVKARYSEVSETMAWLERRNLTARLTGSGSCVFSVFDQQSDALAILEQLPGCWQGFVARGLNLSPLRALCVSVGLRNSGGKVSAN